MVEEESSVVYLTRGRKIFRTACLNPWTTSRLRDKDSKKRDQQTQQDTTKKKVSVDAATDSDSTYSEDSHINLGVDQRRSKNGDAVLLRDKPGGVRVKKGSQRRSSSPCRNKTTCKG